MAGRPVNPEKIIELLAELKTKTPDYPPELLEARKAAFMQQVISIGMQGNGPGGESGGGNGGGSGGSGSGAFGGMSGIQGVLLQATIGVWVIAAMLTAAYVFRDQIVDLLQGNRTVEVTQAPPVEQMPTEFVAPLIEPSPTELLPTETPEPVFAGDGSEDYSERILEDGVPSETVEGAVDENGKALGLTPGAPDVPGQGDPNATNKDKNSTPDKPDKPEKTPKK